MVFTGSIHQFSDCFPLKKTGYWIHFVHAPVFYVTLFLLFLLCASEPLVQQLLAVVDLPAVHLHSDDDHQVHDGHSGEAEDEAVCFAVPVELLRHREHLHGAVDERGHAEEPGTDHGDDQVADVVTRQCQEAEDCGDYAQEVRVLPLVWRGYYLVGNQAELAHRHLSCYQHPDQQVDNVEFTDFRLQGNTHLIVRGHPLPVLKVAAICACCSRTCSRSHRENPESKTYI